MKQLNYPYTALTLNCRMNTSVLKLIFSLLIGMGLTLPTNAQNEKRDGDDLGTEQVNVIQDYKPTIVDAVKLNDNPPVNDSTPLNPKLSYTFLNKKLNKNFELEPIAPAKMKGEPLNKLYKSYIKAGLGTYTTPYFEAFINSLRKKEYQIGMHAKHLSSTFSSKDLGYAGFSDNEIGVAGKYFLKDNIVSAAMEYNYNGMHYYGVDRQFSDTVLDKKLTEQAYGNFGIAAGLLSTHNDSDKINYEANLKYYNFSEQGPAFENNVFVDATLSKFVKTELFGGNLAVDYYSNKNSLQEFNEALISVAPFVKAAQEKWQATIGIKVTVESNAGKTHFFPNLHAKYNLVENILSAYLDVDGKTERNSYKKMATENPFILSSLPIENTTTPLNATLGIRGNVSSEISFHISGTYTSLKNMPLYVNYATNFEQSRFTVIYDNANLFQVHGELAYTKSDKFRLGGKVDYYKYAMENEVKAWHKPSLMLSFSGKYNLQDKIWITADVFTINKQYAKISEFTGLAPVSNELLITESTRELKGIADVNLGVEYLYNKRLSAFVKFNNIAAYRYYRWNNYPTQRFNLMAGVTYSF
jgi:hypothetical protein